MKNALNQPTIDQYLSTLPQGTKHKLQELREFIKSLVPNMTETISYGIPTFDLNGKHLVHFAGFKKHIGFYPFPSGIEKFKKETTKYVTSKGTIQFPLDQPIPYDLVKKIVKYRAEENMEKYGEKS